VDADSEADFRRYVAARSGALWRQAYLMCGDRHLAEDLVQAALAKLYVKWKAVRRRDAVDAYTRRVLVRLCIEQAHPRRRRERSVGTVPDAAAAAAGPAVEERAVLLQALGRLPLGQRAVVVLRFWEDLSIEETASVLGCSPGNVKSQTARGLEGLREVLRGFEGYEMLTGETA
jgi:RNA polymerase sigma-70 factor (sigma-E family)